MEQFCILLSAIKSPKLHFDVWFDDWRENETLIEVLDEGRYERPIISNRD